MYSAPLPSGDSYRPAFGALRGEGLSEAWQRVPVRQYVRDVVRTLSTQYATLTGPVRSDSTLLLLLQLLHSSCRRCWRIPSITTVYKRLK
jgi:hypothetical protein